MPIDDRPTAALLTAGRYRSADGKTAHGLVRGPSRYRIVGVVDGPAYAGHDAGEMLDGVARGIPIVATLDELLKSPQPPRWAVIGVATSGGVLSPELRATVLDAVQRGVSAVNGLHDLLGDDAEIRGAAEGHGVTLVDLRRPKSFRQLAFWNGSIRTVRAPRIAVLGTDCALGKRTTAQLLVAGCRAAGIRAELVTTGQTGWLQGNRFGFILDATPNDFVCGELERAVVACDQKLHPDLILIEGQSALRNPSGPCGAELLLGAEAHGVVLQHAPARKYFEDQEPLGNLIPALADEIDLVARYGARVVAVTLNHEGLDAAGLVVAKEAIARETGLPVVDPLIDGVDAVIPAIRAFLDAPRR